MSERKFWIEKNGSQLGPFSQDELKGYQIFEETLIWHEGLENWTPASQVTEIGELLIKRPPPLPGDVQKEYDHKLGTGSFEKFKLRSEPSGSDIFLLVLGIVLFVIRIIFFVVIPPWTYTTYEDEHLFVFGVMGVHAISAFLILELAKTKGLNGSWAFLGFFWPELALILLCFKPSNVKRIYTGILSGNNDLSELVELANEAYNQQNFQEVKYLASAVESIEPLRSDINLLKLRVYLRQFLLDDALSSIRNLLSIDPNVPVIDSINEAFEDAYESNSALLDIYSSGKDPIDSMKRIEEFLNSVHTDRDIIQTILGMYFMNYELPLNAPYGFVANELVVFKISGSNSLTEHHKEGVIHIGFFSSGIAGVLRGDNETFYIGFRADAIVEMVLMQEEFKLRIILEDGTVIDFSTSSREYKNLIGIIDDIKRYYSKRRMKFTID